MCIDVETEWDDKPAADTSYILFVDIRCDSDYFYETNYSNSYNLFYWF